MSLDCASCGRTGIAWLLQQRAQGIYNDCLAFLRCAEHSAVLELPLSQAAEAHRLLEWRHTTGKVILRPPWA